MPEKQTTYQRTRFTPATLDKAFDVAEVAMREVLPPFKAGIGGQLVSATDYAFDWSSMSVSSSGVKWTFTDKHEFLAELRRDSYDWMTVGLNVRGFIWSVGVNEYSDSTLVTINAPERGTVERISAVFDEVRVESQRPLPELPPPPPPRVFIGHGRSAAWRDLKDHLADQHGFDVVAYETGARAGHTIRDVLEAMLTESTFALIVMTAEDEQAADADGAVAIRARQNVVHEAGLFQGRLGFPRAIILLEEGTELFSNVAGVQYIGFGAGRIREAFGDVVATLRREFGT